MLLYIASPSTMPINVNWASFSNEVWLNQNVPVSSLWVNIPIKTTSGKWTASISSTGLEHNEYTESIFKENWMALRELLLEMTQYFGSALDQICGKFTNSMISDINTKSHILPLDVAGEDKDTNLL